MNIVRILNSFIKLKIVMNKNIFSISLVVSMLFLFSCADENLSPILTFDIAEKGAYAKLLEETPRELDLANLSTASYDYCVEFVDLEAGSTVSEYNIAVIYEDNNPGNGDNSAGPNQFMSIPASAFNSTDRNFAGACLSVTLSELLGLFNLSSDDLLANDQFSFVTTVTTTSGASFGAANSSSAVNGSAFGGHFDFTLKATCPLPDDVFVGNYTLTYDGDATGGFGTPFEEGQTVEITTNKPSNTQRSIPLSYLPQFGGFDLTLGFDIVCDFITAEFVDSGVGCGGGGITIAAGAVSPISSLTDDSQVILNVIEYDSDGGCGVEPSPKTIVFTKN